MKNKIIDKCMNNVIKQGNYTDSKLNIIRYGLETLYTTITKMIVIVIIAFILNLENELLWFMLAYGLLRLTGFGLHTKSNISCWVGSILSLIGFPYLISIVSVPRNIASLLMIICVIFIFKYAPADTENRPLIRPKRRMLYKYICTFTSISYSIISLLTNNIQLNNTLLFSQILQVILILPISYKILNLKYNNYLLYKVS